MKKLKGKELLKELHELFTLNEYPIQTLITIKPKTR